MYHLSLPFRHEPRVSFYLAVEEYVAREKRCDEGLFFTWQTGPSVIFGRNQDARREVNVDYCRQHGVATYRRKSGGGCVYADMGNLMLSYVAPGDHVQFIYHQYTTMMVGALRQMGIAAEASGRNDLLVGGGKVSGTAYYQLPGRAIVHGTLLYDTDMEHMTHCLTPDDAKLSSKGVKSVSQRIAILKDHTALTLTEIRDGLTDFLCRDTIALSDDDLKSILRIEQTYRDESFLWGKPATADKVVRSGRLEGVGTLEVSMDISDGRIGDISLAGDFLATGNIGELCRQLTGLQTSRDDIIGRLPADLSHYIAGLTAESLASLLAEDYR